MLWPVETTRFSGFGSCSLGMRLGLRTAELHLGEMSRDDFFKEMRQRLRRHCPKCPGVYGMIDQQGELVYVGKSKSLRHRLISYFRAQAHDEKAGRIIEASVRLIWEPAPHELAALLRELELIRRWLPRFNVQGRPGRFGRTYVCVGRAPAPYVYLSGEPTKRAIACYGPLRSFRRLNEAVRHVNTQFKLRDCPDRVPMLFAEQLSLFTVDRAAQCSRFDFGTCLAPCIGECGQNEYALSLQAARGFLDGSDGALLERLESKMTDAATNRQFERAAMLRDIWEPLAWLDQCLQRLRNARRDYSFVYAVPAANKRIYWYAIRAGQVCYAAFAPRTERAARGWHRRLKQIYSARAKQREPEKSEDLEVLQLTAAWFRKFPQELERTIDPRAARKHCRGLTGNID